MSVKSLESLETWKKSKEFSLGIYREVLPLLPSEEKWNLNNTRFCYIARGSLEETLSHLIIAHEMEFIPEALYDSLAQDGEKLAQLINGYIGYLKRSKQGQNEPGANHSVREEIIPYELDLSEAPKDE